MYIIKEKSTELVILGWIMEMWRKKNIPIRLVSASRCENWKTENEPVSIFLQGRKS